MAIRSMSKIMEISLGFNVNTRTMPSLGWHRPLFYQLTYLLAPYTALMGRTNSPTSMNMRQFNYLGVVEISDS